MKTTITAEMQDTHIPVCDIIPAATWAPSVYTRNYVRSSIVEIHAAKHGQVALCDTLCGFIIFGKEVYWANKAVRPLNK